MARGGLIIDVTSNIVRAGLLGILSLAAFSCHDGGQGRVYDAFFRHSTAEQKQIILTYPLDKQVDIYLRSRDYVRPHSRYLGSVIANNGESLVPELRYRLERANSDDERADLFWVFSLLEAQGHYSVATDSSLMEFLTRQAQAIDSLSFKESAMNSLRRIQLWSERRKAQAP